MASRIDAIEALTRINLDDLVSSFGWEGRPLLNGISRRIFRSAAETFARQVAAFDTAVGTHGLVWFVMVCYGFPGLALLLAWMVGMLISSARAPNPIALWAHVAIVVFVVQTPIYGLLPQIMIVGLASAVALRAQQLGELPPPEPPSPNRGRLSSVG